MRPWFVTLWISLGRLPVTVFNSLNDQQPHILLKFRESKEPIQFKVSNVVTGSVPEATHHYFPLDRFSRILWGRYWFWGIQTLSCPGCPTSLPCHRSGSQYIGISATCWWRRKTTSCMGLLSLCATQRKLAQRGQKPKMIFFSVFFSLKASLAHILTGFVTCSRLCHVLESLVLFHKLVAEERWSLTGGGRNRRFDCICNIIFFLLICLLA